MSLLETTFPAHTRRRTWAFPELTSHSLLVMTFQRLYLAPPTGSPRQEVLAAAEGGANLDDLLGPLATVVDLGTIRRLRLDLVSNSLVVEYAGGGVGASRVVLTFATPQAADTCFTKLWRRLGDGFTLTPFKRDTWELIRGPVGLLVGTLLLTALFVLGLSVVEDMAADRAASGAAEPNLLPGWLGWKLVCAVGGVVAAVSQVWLYRRLTTPPVSLELVRA